MARRMTGTGADQRFTSIRTSGRAEGAANRNVLAAQPSPLSISDKASALHAKIWAQGKL